MYKPIPYHITAVAVYACIVIICILALFYGRRARRNVKREKVTALSRGFSPLDVQRIFIGKTYPRKLTRALIVHWAQMGYIRVTYIDRNTVKIKCLKLPPAHDSDESVFFDRGTYVREREIFLHVLNKKGIGKTIKLNKPLISRSSAKLINDCYAVREDEGVYSSKHYKLKVFTFILSLLPFFFCGLYLCVVGTIAGIIFPFMMLLGMFFFRFVREIPLGFRIVWSSAWVVASTVMMIVLYSKFYDPFLLAWVSVATFFIGSYLLIRFVDYREKNNLSDYSDLINYKKFLLFSSKLELDSVNYFEVLPYIYAFNIKFLVKRKFNTLVLPDWFVSETGERGTLF